MAVNNFNDNIRVNANKPLDFKFGPFDDIAQANSLIPIAQRYHGLMFGIYTQPLDVAISDIDYFYYYDGLTDVDYKPFDGQIISGTTNYVSKFNVTGDNLENSQIFDNNTSVGIGTISPTEKLDVNGNIKADGQIYSPVNAKGNSGAATVAFNWNEGNIQTVTMTGNATFTFSNPQSGASYQIIITQDVTGGRTITWPTIKWEGGSAPSLTGTANSRDIVTLTYDGSSYYGVIAKNFA